MLTAKETDYYESGFPKLMSREKWSIPLNERLRYVRMQKKITLAKATKELNKRGISCAISTLQSYEAAEESLNRRYPSLKMLISLANLYECSTDFLFGISDEMNRHTNDLHTQMERNKKVSWRNKEIQEQELNMMIFKMDQIMSL
jgi:transcriptional regulator with XRE-family HTH domain